MLYALSTALPFVKQKSPKLLALSTGPAILYRWSITAIARVSGGYWDERNVLGHWEAIGHPVAGREKKKKKKTQLQAGSSVVPAEMPLKPGQLV